MIESTPRGVARTSALSVCAALLLTLTCVASAQEADEPFVRLVGARSLKCQLGKGTQASWDERTLKLKGSDWKAGDLIFDSIDAKSGKARIIGNAGAADLHVLVTGAGLTFVETTAFGNINFTTVFAAYDSSTRFVAVSSRHQNLNGPFPSQYHGTCSVLE